MSATSALRTATVQRKSSSSASRGGLLQRKCGCGSAKSPLGESCNECQSHALQPKLVVGVSNDPYELEADRIAEQVLALNPDRSGAAPSISRIGSQLARASAVAPASVERTLASGGTPLPPALLHDMEGRFGCDFSRVRIHVGSGAEQSAHDVSANAYTVGNDIVFGTGQFSPSTRSGRRLLAHELTHVVQQSSRRASAVLRKPGDRNDPDPGPTPETVRHLPESVSPTSQRAEMARYAVRDNIQWHIPTSSPEDHLDRGEGLDLVFRFFEPYDPKARKYSSGELSEFAVAVMQDATGLRFKPGMREFFVDFIASVIRMNSGGLSGPFRHFIEVDGLGFSGFSMSLNLMYSSTQKPEFRSLFDEESWNGWVAFMRANFTDKRVPLGGALVASANLGDKLASQSAKKKGAGESRPQWSIDQEKKLRKLIDEARKRKPPPPDLPDRLVFYPHKDTWYLNVWVHFDVQGKDRTHKAIRLKQNELPEALYERTIQAVHGALEVSRAEERKHREAEMPEWATQLKTHVERAFGKKKARDIPDGMTLTLEGRGAKTRGPGREGHAEKESTETAETQVLLRIWVEQGEEKEKEKETARRNYGSVPIFPDTARDELVKYVRNLAAVLREFEAVPDDVEFNPTYKLGEQMLPNFEAKVLPLDLRAENITVTAAKNKFSLFLDFEKQYQAIGSHPLFVASKLYNQPIYYHWKIFEVPADRRQLVRSGEREPSWDERWEWLYDQYNPGSGITAGGDIRATTRAGTVPVPPGGYETGDDDITTRVSFPDEPGEYLVYCQTGHKPIGDEKLRRVSSVAYYPVRTETKETITTPLITQGSRALKSAKDQQDELRAQLEALRSSGKASPTEEKALDAALEMAKGQTTVLETRESAGLIASTEAQIKDGTKRLELATRLKNVLPDILKKAKANALAGVEPSKPSKLLEDRPDLLALYVQLTLEHKHAAGYEKELQSKLKELQKVLERARKYEDEFKEKSAGGCVYTPEAVFLSKLDGRLYPLVLMVGESPVRNPGDQVAYTVVDVTTPQTTKRYRGGSTESSTKGHQEAIDAAFGKFGDQAMYGEGWIAVRMPPGGPGAECRGRRGTDIHMYKSEEGILDKVIKALGFIAAFVAIAALMVSGFGAPAAGALIGALAGVMGAISAVHNIKERADRKTLAFDAELVMDILAIVGVAELAATARLATLQRAVRGFQAYERLGRFLAVYRLTSEGASAVLIPLKLKDDLDKIEALDLPPDQKRRMIQEAWGGAGIGLLMAVTMSATTRVMARAGGRVLPIEEDYAAVRQQTELAALEQTGDVKSLREQGWIDADGKWTDKAPAAIRKRAAEQARAAAGETPPPEPIPEAAQKAIDKVNRGDARIEGKTPGKRRADLEDGHEIIEVVEFGGGIACEYHSPGRTRIPCPTKLGSKPSAPEVLTPPREAPAVRKGGAPREDAPAETRPPTAERPAKEGKRPVDVETPARLPGEGAPSAPRSEDDIRAAALTELHDLRAKVAANNQKIKANEPELAKAQAKVAERADTYTQTPHGSDTSDAGRAQMQRKAKAKESLDSAEKHLKSVKERTAPAEAENKKHHDKMRELDGVINPKPTTTAQKGDIGEAEGHKFMAEQDFEFVGSSKDPKGGGDSAPQGLDGVYRNKKAEGPKNVVGEAKYDKSKLAPGQDEIEWVDARLEQAVGWKEAERIRNEGYEYWVLRYKPGTKEVIKTKLWEWRPSGQRGPRGSKIGTVHR